MNIAQMTDYAKAKQAERRENPEGVTVRVLSPDEATCRALAAQVAQRLYPGRDFGDVLHVEQEDDTSWLVTVQDCGYRPQGKGF